MASTFSRRFSTWRLKVANTFERSTPCPFSKHLLSGAGDLSRVTLKTLVIPESVFGEALSSRSIELISLARERIDAFSGSGKRPIENFVNCDFESVGRSLRYLIDHHFIAGNRFCEWGSGFGVATMLATLGGMEAVGIEIEPSLVEASQSVADDLAIPADFFCGSFVPGDLIGVLESDHELKHIEVHEGDAYDEIGRSVDEFDLFFAFPWPGEYKFFRRIFDCCSASGSLLMTYHGREGMRLVRKID